MRAVQARADRMSTRRIGLCASLHLPLGWSLTSAEKSQHQKSRPRPCRCCVRGCLNIGAAEGLHSERSAEPQEPSRLRRPIGTNTQPIIFRGRVTDTAIKPDALQADRMDWSAKSIEIVDAVDLRPSGGFSWRAWWPWTRPELSGLPAPLARPGSSMRALFRAALF